MASADVDITLETIAPSKLLNYVTKERLVQFVSPAKYAEIEQRLRRLLDKSQGGAWRTIKHCDAKHGVMFATKNPGGVPICVLTLI